MKQAFKKVVLGFSSELDIITCAPDVESYHFINKIERLVVVFDLLIFWKRQSVANEEISCPRLKGFDHCHYVTVRLFSFSCIQLFQKKKCASSFAIVASNSIKQPKARTGS